MTRSTPVPSSSVNLRSFFDFGTASQARTFTARKSLLEKVSKSTYSSNKGSIFTLEKSIGSSLISSSTVPLAPPITAVSSGFFSVLAAPSGFIVGKSKQSRMLAVSVSSITRRSTPMPKPPVGGMPYSKAHRKSSSTSQASSSPAALRAA